jgi:hypothetical protein
MMILAIFLSICAVAVLFLLRFLTALDSEIKSARTRPVARMERISTDRVRHGNRVRGSAPAITLVYSRSRLAVRPRPVSPDVFVSRAGNSQV